jgi:predicted TIM-barrel fold metal-dependent hydrolase
MHAYPPNEAFPTGLVNRLTGGPPLVTGGEAHIQACLTEMERLNIVQGVVSGGDGDRLAAAENWRATAPERIVAGAGIRGSVDVPLPDIELLRAAFVEGRLSVLGEISAQYAGLTLSDWSFDPYLALAEELDIPVALHTGIGPSGISFEPCCRGFRANLGNPLTVEEAINRHPALRLNLMHAGWPFLQETIAILKVYPQVNADLGWVDWGLPRAEFHAYLNGLMRAGVGERLMFGSDQMYWPEAIGMAVQGIEEAAFLTEAEKRDLFYNNAARFYRIDGGSRPHEPDR